MSELDSKFNGLSNHIFYLSTPPAMSNIIVNALCKTGLTTAINEDSNK